MYKFICANITKPRNATNSYKKLAHTKKIHQDSSKSQAAPRKEYLDENQDEIQEYNEEENGVQENPSTSTSPPGIQKFAMASKLPNLKTIQPAPALKMKVYPKFYTGNFIIVDPPTPSISKKYYHIYSISPSSFTKRPYSSGSYRKFLSDEARENYKRAMENICSIQQKKSDFQFRLMNISNKQGSPSTDTWVKKIAKKKVPDIRYPTHTIKHNLTLTKRYKIREGSADRKKTPLEDKFKIRKQVKSLKNLKVRKITYPKLVVNLKKGKLNVPPIRPEKKSELSYYKKYNTTEPPVTHVVKNNPPTQEPQQIFNAKHITESEYGNIDKDFETLIKSHPTIENASKEVKMKLKTKFIQLLLKTARSSVRKPKTEVIPSEKTTPKEDIQVANTVVTREEGSVVTKQLECKKEISGKDAKTTEQHNEASNIISHPRSLEAPKITEKDYMLVKYPKRVWVDDENTYDVQNICIKDNTTRSGTGLITSHYAKESPKPNYKKVEEEAQELSKFVNKFKHLQYNTDEIILKFKKGSESSGGTGTKLEELKKARLKYIKELEKLNVRLAAANAEKSAKGRMTNCYVPSNSVIDNTQTDADDGEAVSPKSTISIDCDNNQNANSNTLKKKEDLEKIRKILTGEIKGDEEACGTKETKRNTIKPQNPNKSNAIKDPQQDITKTEPDVMVNVWKDKRAGQRIFYKNKPNHLNQNIFEVVKFSDSVSPKNKPNGKWPFVETTNTKSLGHPNKTQTLNQREEHGTKTTQGHSMPKSQILNTSEDVLGEPLKMGNPPTDTDTVNKFDIRENILCKKIEPAEEWIDKIEVQEKDTCMDITHTSLKTFKAAKDQDAKEGNDFNDAENVGSEVKCVATSNNCSTVQAKSAEDTLDEVSTVDELNERAKEAEEKFHKRRTKREERQKVQMEREKMKSWPSNKTLNIIPRIDKADDYKNEQYQRGEEVKRKIEQIVPERYNIKPELTTDERLSENAESLNNKKRISSSRRNSLDHPEVKPEQERRTIIQEEWNNENLEDEEVKEKIKPKRAQKRAPKNEGNLKQKRENEELPPRVEKTQCEELNEFAESLIKKDKLPKKGYSVVGRPNQRRKRDEAKRKIKQMVPEIYNVKQEVTTDKRRSENAGSLNNKQRISSSRRSSLDQPEVKPEQEKRMKIQENLLKTEQDQKVKEDLDELYQNKQEERNNEILEDEEVKGRITPKITQKREPKNEDNFEQRKENEELTLDEKTQCEELNEIAESSIKKEKRRTTEYTMDHPVVERPNQRRKSEEAKRNIEQIKQDMTTDKRPNENAESVNNKQRISSSRRYSLEQPEVKPEQEKRMIIKENNLKTEQDQNVKEELDNFSQKKQGEWNNEVLEGEEVEERTVPQKSIKRSPKNDIEQKKGNEELTHDEQLNEIAESLIKKEKPRKKGYTLDHPVIERPNHPKKRVMQENDSKRIQDRNKQQEWTEDTCEDKIALKSNQEEAKSTGKSRESPPTVHPNVMKTSNEESEIDQRSTCSRDQNIPSSKLKGSESDVDLKKQTEHLRKAVEAMESKKIVSPIIQENRDMKYSKNEPTATNEYKEQVLEKYFEPKILPGTDETVYTPKEKLIVHNIDEIDDNEGKTEVCEESKSLSGQDKTDKKKDKPKGPNDMVLPPKIRGSTPEKRNTEAVKSAADQGEARSVETKKPVESQSLESPESMTPKSSPQQNLEPNRANQPQKITTELLDVKKEKLDEVSVDEKNISIQNEKNTKGETEILKKENIIKYPSTEKDIINAKDNHEKQSKISINAKNEQKNEKDCKVPNEISEKNQINTRRLTNTGRSFYDPHTEKVRKYFARKYGPFAKSNKSKGLNESLGAGIGTTSPDSKMQSQKNTDIKNETPKQMQNHSKGKKMMQKPSETKVQDSPNNKVQNQKLSENKTYMQKLPASKPKMQKSSESKMKGKKPPEDKPKPPENSPPSQKPPENNMQLQKPPENKLQMQNLPENKIQVQQSSDNKQQTQKCLQKKIVKAPSKSLSRDEKNTNELAPETNKVLNPTKSASHLDQMPGKVFEADKPVKSSTVKGSTRTPSSRSQVLKIGMRGTKTKYSSWSMQGRVGRQINSAFEHRAVLKKITSDETIPLRWGSSSRSASDAPRRTVGFKKPKVLMNTTYFRGSVSKDRSEDKPGSSIEKRTPNNNSAKLEAVSNPKDETSKPVVFTSGNSKQLIAEPSHVQVEQAKRKKQVIELAKVLTKDINTKQEEQISDLSKAIPKIFWADTNVAPQSRMADQHFKQVKPILELTKVLTSENSEQKQKTDKNADINLLEKKPILELSKRQQKLTENSMVQKKKKSESPKLPSSYTSPELCLADKNLRQDKPVGTLIVRLPRIDRKNYLSLSAERRTPGQGTKLPGYSSETQVLTGKKTPKLTDVMDLDNSENKIAKAGISTTPTMKDLDDKDFGGPRKSIDKITDGKEVEKLPQEGVKEKTAIFRIQYDGEVFIIKKADETLDEAIDKKKKEQTFSNVDSMDGSTEPITELKQTVQHPKDLNNEDIVILQKYNSLKENKNKLELENKQLSQLEEPSKLPKITSASMNQRDSAKSDIKRQKPPNTRSAEDSKPKLTAKVEEIMVKPMKDKNRSGNEDGPREKVILQQSAIRTDPILKKHKPKEIKEALTLKHDLKDNTNKTKSAEGNKPRELPDKKQNAMGITQETNLLTDLKECAHHDTLQVPSNNAKANVKKKEQKLQEATISENVINTANIDTGNRNTMHDKTDSGTLNSAKNKQNSNLETSSKEFTKVNNIYISKAFNTTSTMPENNNTLSNLPSNVSTPKTRDISIKETPNRTIDPFKDISYYGSVKSDCVEKTEISVKETTKKTNKMNNLNAPKTNAQIPPGSSVTIRVPNFDSDLHGKGTTIHKREPSLFRVKIVPENTEHSQKAIVAINPEEVKIIEHTTKHQNLSSEDIIFSKTKLYEDHLKMMEPKKSVEILYPKEINISDIKIMKVEPKPTASLQLESIFKNRGQPKDDSKITEDKNASKGQESKHTHNSSPKVKVAESKTINVKHIPVLKNKTRKPEIKTINKAKTEGRIVREKPKLVESRLSASQIANRKVSGNRSVEKIISKENLISEIQTWVSNNSSVASNRKAKSEQEKVRPKEPAQMRLNVSKRKKINNTGKINTDSENKTETIQKPLKTSQSEHVKAVLPETPTEKNDSRKEKKHILPVQERNENMNVSDKATVGDINKPIKKFPINEDKFMSIDKSLRRNAQRVLSDLLKSSQDAGPSTADEHMTNFDVAKPPASKTSKLNVVKKKPDMFSSKIDEIKKQKKSELQRNTKKHKNEQHARQQEKRFKKEVVEEMNDAADEIYQKEKMRRDRTRGTRRQEKDVKVIQPSVGSGPWGTKIKKPPSGNNEDKKNIHDGTNVAFTPSKEKLMSKSEFLRLKQLKAQQNSSTTSNLRQTEFQQNIQELQKHLATKGATETEMELYKQSKEHVQHEEARLNLTNLGNEIHKYLDQKNAHKENPEKNVLKGKDGRPDEYHANKHETKDDLYNRIDQEIETKIKPKAEWPPNVFTSDTLYFKVTKMAEKIANHLKGNEENEGFCMVNENKSKNKEKQDTTLTETSPQVQSADENKFASDQLKMWSEAEKPTENKAKQTKADSGGITKKDFSLKMQQKNHLRQTGQPISKGYSDMRRPQNSLSVDDRSKKSVSQRSSEKLTSSDNIPNSFDMPTLQEKRKREIEEMIEIKTKNKMARRLRATNLRNMIRQPTRALITFEDKSGVNPPKEIDTDKEEMGTNIVKGPNFIFKPKSLSSPTKKKPSIRKELKTWPKYEDTSRMQKIPCEKIVLPLQNPQVIDKILLDPQMSTLDKPLLDEIKTVPKEILEAEEKVRKASQKLTLYGRKTDPLAKYRHLKITYMTVNRQAKKEDEKFLPDLVKKIEERENDEENKNQIINFRFELLRRLNEEFKKQLAEQSQKPPVNSKHRITPIASDSDVLKDVKSDLEKEIESFTENNMNAAKILSEIKPVGSLQKGLENIKKSKASDKGGNKKTGETSKSNKITFPDLKPDNNDGSGPGGVRRYSTDSTK